MARNYRIQKRREKRNSFSTSMRISHSGRRVRASLSTEIRPEETDEFSTVHRFLA